MIILLIHFLTQSLQASNFTDRDLAVTLRTKCSGSKRCIIYTWSPHMPLSVRGFQTVQAYGRQHNLTIIPLVDPVAKATFAARVERDKHLPKTRTLASETLIRRGARVHYPSYNFARGGTLRGPLIPGVRRPAALDNLVRKYLR